MGYDGRSSHVGVWRGCRERSIGGTMKDTVINTRDGLTAFCVAEASGYILS